MSLFTPIQISLLQDVAASRSQQLEMEALQPYADYLYQSIVEDIGRERDAIFSDLLRATRDSESPDAISIPLWRFVSSNPPPKEHNDGRMDSYIGVYDRKSIAKPELDWVLPPVTIEELLHKTDICARLSAFLAPDTMWVHPGRPNAVWIEGEEEWCQNNLMITFYPKGLDPVSLASLEAVKAKYQSSYYTSRPLEENDVVFIRAAGVFTSSGPRTPDFGPSSAARSPPPIKRPQTLKAETDDEDDQPVSPPCFCESCTGFTYPDPAE